VKKNLFILWIIFVVYIGATQYYTWQAKNEFTAAVEKLGAAHEKYQAKQFQLLVKTYQQLEVGDKKEGLELLKSNIGLNLPFAKKYYDGLASKECEKGLCNAIKYAEGL
jgi:uncharacterized protein YpmB